MRGESVTRNVVGDMLVPSSSDEEDDDYPPQNQQNGKIPSSDASKAKAKEGVGGSLGVPSHGSVR